MFVYGSLQSETTLSPQTSIKLHNPSNNLQNCDVDAIVDTGAVMTCIPESKISELGNSLIYSEIIVVGANGIQRKRKTYRMKIKIADHDCMELEVIAIPKEYALIGRDILNRHKVVLNAPRQLWGLGCNDSLCPRDGSK